MVELVVGVGGEFVFVVFVMVFAAVGFVGHLLLGYRRAAIDGERHVFLGLVKVADV